MRIARRIVSLLVPECVKGAVEYYRFPERRHSWGGSFNGQEGREKIFALVMNKVRPMAIVETGTYRGTTTARFAQTGLPVFSVEGQARNFGFASAHLRAYKNARLLLGDSRSELRKLLAGPLSNYREKPLFFYLDAHWNADLPLAEELEIIYSTCSQAMAMIDDFKVPFDAGYGYDDYGPGAALDANYIDETATRFDLTAFYPALPSNEETGMRRGCVLLTNSACWTKQLRDPGLLRHA